MTHFTNIQLSELKTYADCDRAIDSIEMDSRNVQGGHSAFYSGYECYLLKGAENKIAAIQRKQDRICKKQIKASWKEYLKCNEYVSFEDYEDQELYA